MEAINPHPFEPKESVGPKIDYSAEGALLYAEHILQKAGTVEPFQLVPGRFERLTSKWTKLIPETEAVRVRFDSLATSFYLNGTTSADTQALAHKIFGEVTNPQIVVEASKRIVDDRYKKLQVKVLTDGARNTNSPLGINLTFFDTPEDELKAEAEVNQRGRRPYRKELNHALRAEFSSRIQAIIKYLGQVSMCLENFETRISLTNETDTPEIRTGIISKNAAQEMLNKSNTKIVWSAKK